MLVIGELQCSSSRQSLPGDSLVSSWPESLLSSDVMDMEPDCFVEFLLSKMITLVSEVNSFQNSMLT